MALDFERKMEDRAIKFEVRFVTDLIRNFGEAPSYVSTTARLAFRAGYMAAMVDGGLSALYPAPRADVQ